VDVRRISALDAVGIASILQFVQPIIETGGTIHIIDPDEHLRHLIDPRHCGIIHTAEPPNGNWWG
jgi:ABC-type transporter Mla MlaB component